MRVDAPPSDAALRRSAIRSSSGTSRWSGSSSKRITVSGTWSVSAANSYSATLDEFLRSAQRFKRDNRGQRKPWSRGCVVRIHGGYAARPVEQRAQLRQHRAAQLTSDLQQIQAGVAFRSFALGDAEPARPVSTRQGAPSPNPVPAVGFPFGDFGTYSPPCPPLELRARPRRPPARPPAPATGPGPAAVTPDAQPATNLREAVCLPRRCARAGRRPGGSQALLVRRRPRSRLHHQRWLCARP